MVRRIEYTPEEWEAHQRKVASYRSARSPKERENLPAKRPANGDKRTRARVKYGNESVVEDGLRHASRKEHRRWHELGLLLKSKEISFLARQVRFILPGNLEYVADFFYGTFKCDEFGHVEVAKFVVEDVKSAGTINIRPYVMKKALMLSTYNIEIIEV